MRQEYIIIIVVVIVVVGMRFEIKEKKKRIH